MFVLGLVLRTDLRKGVYTYMYTMRRVLKCAFAMTEFNRPEVTLCNY